MEQDFKFYRKKQLAKMRPYVVGESMEGIAIGEAARTTGSPKLGDMIAQSQENPLDIWLVDRQFFADNYDPNPVPPPLV